VSFWCSVQVSPERMKTYTEPASSNPEWSSPQALITAVSPDTRGKQPNASPGSASEAVSFCCSVQVSPERMKTYAEPASTPPTWSSAHAPISTVSPDIVAFPKLSPLAASEAISFATTLTGVVGTTLPLARRHNGSSPSDTPVASTVSPTASKNRTALDHRIVSSSRSVPRTITS